MVVVDQEEEETRGEKRWVFQTVNGWLARMWLIDFELDSNGRMAQGVPPVVLVNLRLFTRRANGRCMDHVQGVFPAVPGFAVYLDLLLR